MPYLDVNIKTIGIWPRQRHYQTAEAARIPAKTIRELFVELVDTVEAAITAVQDELPRSFPAPLAASIFTGLRNRADVITTQRDA